MTDRPRSMCKRSLFSVFWPILFFFGLTAISACQVRDIATANGPSPESTPCSGYTMARSDESTVFISAGHGFTLSLPAHWIAVGPDLELASPESVGVQGTSAESTCVHVYRESPVELQEGLVMAAALPGDTTDLDLSVAQLSVIVVPAPELTLDTFLSATEDEMGRHAEVASIGTEIDDTLRPELRPTAVLTYVLAAGSAGQDAVAGFQSAFFDTETTNLIVLSFTTKESRMAELLSDFEQIVRSVEIR